ncbi:MAG: N-acetyl-alpha-D-glucosaminyl L-malate synthase BshA [Candidatus Binatia bacterium]
MSDPARLRIGITCYPTFGGSGVIAAEVGQELARRGHRVHFICQDLPARLDHLAPNVFFHAVQPREYPLFQDQPYTLALASRMVEVAEYEGLDLLHVHYAVPHATSAYLARQILGAKAPRLVTTLHGTDITLVGNDASYLPITRFSIEQSDAVTAPSRYLVEATRREIGIRDDVDIEVIGNFVDTDLFVPDRSRRAETLAWIFPDSLAGSPAADVAVVVHVSNFRPVKRVDLVVKAFAKLAATRPALLVLIGDGPERGPVQALVRSLGLQKRCCFLGNREDCVPALQAADLFLQASDSESFGLAALEAQACGVPVVSTAVGGVPEVIRDGETGLLAGSGNADALADAASRLLGDAELWRKMSAAARRGAVENFGLASAVDRYEDCYRRLLARYR